MTAVVAAVSTGDLVRAVTPALATDLASPAAIARLIAAGGQLPMTSGGGFECHLGNPNRVDLSVRFFSGEAGTESLLAGSASCQMVDGSILSLLRQWMQGETLSTCPPLSSWLEYDLEAERASRPSIFLGPGNSFQPDPSRLDLSIWKRVLQSLAPYQTDTNLISGFSQLHQALPSNACIGYAGKMAGDADHHLRVTVSGILPGQITLLLQAIRWRGADMTAAAELAAISGARITLSLDLGREPEPKLGVELALPPNGDWTGMLQRVLPAGNCDLGLLPALLAWPGVTCCGDEHWPDSLRPLVWGIARRLNHLKLVYRGTQPPQIKAYLYYGVVERS